MHSILLQGGTIVLRDENHLFRGFQRDILICGERIERIAKQIDETPRQCHMIDCKGKIISPGFIDTHRHMWQTQLRGRHADETYDDYIQSGMLKSCHYSPTDVFWGQLSAAMECIDAGTTTVVDHAHMIHSSQHARAGISALGASGIRAAFCLTPTPGTQIKDDSSGAKDTALPEWFYRLLTDLAAEQPWHNGRIRLGLGFDMFSMRREIVINLYQRARRFGIGPLSSHQFHGPHGMNAMAPLDAYGLLGPDVLLCHGTGLVAADWVKLSSLGVGISATPSAEALLGLGTPVTSTVSCPDVCSLGGDNPSLVSASLPEQARCGLLLARADLHRTSLQMGRQRSNQHLTCQRAFSMLTVNGARALGMEDKLGTIEEGKMADLVIFSSTTPAMVSAAQLDPVIAIVMHSSPRDIETVIIDGNIRKSEGHLRGTTGPPDQYSPIQRHTDWQEICKNVLLSRSDILLEEACSVRDSRFAGT